MRGPIDTKNENRPKRARATCPSHPRTSGRGRRETISDEELSLRRNALVMLFEFKWGEVAWKLQHVKRADSLQVCLADLSTAGDIAALGPVVQCLLRDGAREGTRKRVRESQDAYFNLQDEQSAAQDGITLELDRLTEALVAFREARSKPRIPKSRKSGRNQHANLLRRVRHVVRDRKSTYKQRIALWNLLEAKRRNLQDEMQKQEAAFARNELFRFLRSKKYKLNPRNLANALAGLPIIGWRQSFRRCKPLPYVCGPSIHFLSFRFLTKFLTRSIPNSQAEAERVLRDLITRFLPKKNSRHLSETKRAAAHLNENWELLRKAIRDSWPCASQSREIPYILSAVFVRNQFRKHSALENLLASS